MAEPVWFHIDVNSAFLSWTAAYRTLVEGRTPDLREIPSVIANDKNLRTSIVLAKSTPAKKYGVKTGEPLGMARDKCPNLVVAEPDYALYVSSSRRLMALLREVSPVVEQYSIDEAWVDMTGTEGLYGPPVLAAQRFGHGSPSNESRAPSVPPRIGCTFGIMPSSSIALFACSTRNMQGSIFSRMLK